MGCLAFSYEPQNDALTQFLNNITFLSIFSSTLLLSGWPHLTWLRKTAFPVINVHHHSLFDVRVYAYLLCAGNSGDALRCIFRNLDVLCF